MRIYTRLKKESVAELSQEDSDRNECLSKLLNCRSSPAVLGDGEGGIEQVSKAKLSLLEETLDDLVAGAGKKIIIFARSSEITATGY